MSDNNANVIQLPQPNHSDGYDGLRCDCGEAWFDAVVCINTAGHVTGYSQLSCSACGAHLEVNH